MAQHVALDAARKHSTTLHGLNRRRLRRGAGRTGVPGDALRRGVHAREGRDPP
jgi:hypothetical protein